jgi:nucleoside 2-deoxyribosyltransferase
MNATIFIGSSSEGLDLARALSQMLSYDAEPLLWPNIFEPNLTTIESLDRIRDAVDFAVLVFRADDLVTFRNEEHRVARDNVIFEYGFFLGELGRERTFVLHGPDIDKLPSDLAGVKNLVFRDRQDQNTNAALDAPLSELLPIVRRLGPRRPKRPVAYWAGPHRNHDRNRALRRSLSELGVDLTLPGDIAPEGDSSSSVEMRKEIRDACIDAINKSSIMLVDLDRYGMDTAWEIGYAEAVGKRIVGLSVDGHIDSSLRSTVHRREYRENFMHGWEHQTTLQSIKELERVVPGRTVHICGPFANEVAMQSIRQSRLAQLTERLVMPSEVLSLRHEQRDHPWLARDEAIRLIDGCDLAVVLLPRYGMDTSWQIGYCAGKGIETVGLFEYPDSQQWTDSPIWEHWMHGWSQKVHLTSVSDAAAIALMHRD